MNDIKNLEIFTWEESYETGLGLIDAHHKQLVSLINVKDWLIEHIMDTDKEYVSYLAEK